MQRVHQVPCNGRQSMLSRLRKKKGIGRQRTTFTSCQNTACSNELFPLSGRLCFGGKRFDRAIVNFGRLLNIFHTERSWHAYWFSLVGMICPLMQEHFLFGLFRNVKFLITGFSLCPWMWLFPARFCHAGPSSLVFLAGCLNSHGWWFTEPNHEEVDWNEGIYSFFLIAIIVNCQLVCSVFLQCGKASPYSF